MVFNDGLRLRRQARDNGEQYVSDGELSKQVITLAKEGSLASRRRIVAELPDEPLVIDKLMNEIAPKYGDRNSGYTRIVKLGQRAGDAAPVVQLELV